MSQANGSVASATTDLVKVERPAAATAYEPHDLDEAFKVAGRLVASGLLPKSVQKPEAALAIIMAGRELGLTTMQSLRSIHIIEGKPSLSADLILALVKRSPTCKWFHLVQSTDKVATYETQRAGEPEPTSMSFTHEDATRAGLMGKDNWRKYPAAMLRARCIAALARAVYPDLTMGIYETDELAPVEEDAPRRKRTTTAPAETPIEAEVVEEQTDEERLAIWGARFEAARTKEDLRVLRNEFKKSPHSQELELSVSRHFDVAQKRINAAAAPREREAGEEG